jgi:hypothetical protein
MSARVMIVAGAALLLYHRSLRAQDLSGRWVYEESGQTVELLVRHDRATGRASGTLSMFGATAPFTGTVASGSLTVEKLGDVRASAENGTMTGQLQNGALMFTVRQPGQSPVTMPMTRRGDPTPPSSSAQVVPGATPSAPVGSGFRAGSASDFGGQWQLRSDDGTNEEIVELTVRDPDVAGSITALEHGYFSKRTTVKARLLVRGTLTNGALQLRFWNEAESPNDAKAATGRVRGEYFVLTIDGAETGYARPGRDLVRSAEGSAEAATLARAVSGRIYSRGSQAGGRGGAIAGGRTRLALCADGTVAYDASDVASAPDGGGTLGNTVSRRGTWGIVLYAGAPMVKAQWQGTGSSYSLTAYFRVRPDAAGRSANVDGVDLPVTGRC